MTQKGMLIVYERAYLMVEEMCSARGDDVDEVAGHDREMRLRVWGVTMKRWFCWYCDLQYRPTFLVATLLCFMCGSRLPL